MKSDIDNVEYSKELLLKNYHEEDRHHLPVIQGYYDDVASFKNYLDWFLKEFNNPSKLALGTMCKSSNKKFVQDVVSHIRRKLPNTWIHAFGLRMYHLPNIWGLINSWDSMSWTFPRTSGRSSCKNLEERNQFFKDYLYTIRRNTQGNHKISFENNKFKYSWNEVNLLHFLDQEKS
ncbi:MAG: hypothetical protein INQ03_06220 [Candidatus Heimdallarchaeota archaeon]|nr:hypothetical protein [Candidatus Heimdallarchaeota archaeon]